MTSTFPPSLLEGLDEGQHRAVVSDSMPLAVLAGAGSGKTRVLTRRVARRVLDESADPSHTLVLTFTRKAAGELRDRLRRLGVADDMTVGTFHSVAYAEMRRRWLDDGRAAPTVLSNPQRLLESVIGELRLDRSVNTRMIAAELSWAKSRLLGPDNYAEGVSQYRRKPPLATGQFTRVFRAYENEKRKRRTVDYDDLLLLLTELMANDKAFVASQRWRFRHFFVDEFQDLNKAQFDLLQSWLGDRSDLFVVGDPNQAIYGWNGADASYLTKIDRYFPGVEVVELRSNYRSTAHVLAAANAVLPNAEARQAATSVIDAPEQGVAPVIRAYPDEKAEALGIAREVRLVRSRSRRWSDIAVLVRTNALRVHVEAALSAARVPFRSTGGAAWMLRPEVKEAVELLRQSPRHKLAERVPDVEQMAMDADDDSYLRELLDGARQCLAEDPLISIADFLSWLEVATKYDGPVGLGRDAGAVTVTTFHRAKGLEWPVVFLAALEDGIVPHGSGGQASLGQLDEEQRLFYVAVTRAREELYCSWSKTRSSHRGVVVKKPSPWLIAIQQAGARLDTVRPSAEQLHEVLEETREALIDIDDDERTTAEVLAELRRWRASRAKATGIAPHLIISDQMLNALAVERPLTPEDFVAVTDLGVMTAGVLAEPLTELIRRTVAS